MDIWDWVRRARRELEDGGHHRLSELVRLLPGAVCDNAHARVDAIHPEAVALARAAGNPWIELFVRHWNLQSRILHRHQVDDWMGEAVALIDFANRPETRDCPQSICVTQDLVNCYGNRDGPGFAAERIAASRETLGRIDATWPCYCCIGGELIEALIDAGRPDEALAEVDRMEAAIARHARWAEHDPMGDSRIAVLRALGRYDEALDVLDRLMDEPEDDDSRVARQLERAWVLCLAGRFDEAAAARPAFERLEGTHSLYRPWVEASGHLARHGRIPNDWRLDRLLAGAQRELAGNGVARHALHVALWRGELAVARGRLGIARACLADIDPLIPRLRAPLDAPTLRDGLAAAIEARAAKVAADPLPDTPEAVLAATGADPEVDLERMSAAAARWPDHEGLAVQRALAHRALGEAAQGEAGLRRWMASHPSRSTLADALLGRFLVERGALDEARAIGDRLAASDEPGVAAMGEVLQLDAARRAGDTAAMLALHRAAVERSPGDPAPVLALASALAADDPREALALLDALMAHDPAPGDWDWLRVVLGTRLDEWAAVRDSATRLGMALEPGEGPIDENWEAVRIRFEADPEDAIGEPYTAWAYRTGPVTARVFSIDGPDEPCHFDDEVIFDPQPVEVDRDEEIGHMQCTYRCLEIRRAGGYRSFVVDGMHPGDEALADLRRRLTRFDGLMRDVTHEAYEVFDPETGEGHPGLYLYVAAPADRLAALDRALARHTKGWPGPAVWPDLLAALGAPRRLAAQRALMEAWGM